MFDFPTSFPPDAFGVVIREVPDGWDVVIYRSVHLMLLAADGQETVPETEHIVAARFHSLARAIQYVHSSRPGIRHLQQWGDRS